MVSKEQTIASPFPFCVELAVRGYEIDIFGHVNNAVYLQWLEHARWELGQHEQLMWSTGDVLPLVRHMTLDYRAETLLGDKVRICLWPRCVARHSFVFGSSIRIVEAERAAQRRCGVVVLTARQVFTCVRRPAGKVAVPEAWRPLFPAEDPGDEFLPEVA